MSYFSNSKNESLSLRKTLSNNIRAFRKDLHLTQGQLAEYTDISLSYLADIEHCKTWISDKTLMKLASALHKQPHELLEENGNNSFQDEKTNILKISEIIHDEKKELMKTVSDICDKTIQEILKAH